MACLNIKLMRKNHEKYVYENGLKGYISKLEYVDKIIGLFIIGSLYTYTSNTGL